MQAKLLTSKERRSLLDRLAYLIAPEDFNILKAQFQLMEDMGALRPPDPLAPRSLDALPIGTKYLIEESEHLCPWVSIGTEGKNQDIEATWGGATIFTHVPYLMASSLVRARQDFGDAVAKIINGSYSDQRVFR